MYKITIPLLIRGLKRLQYIIEKGETFAKEKGFDVENLINARLYPDMFTLIGQVQYACFHALDITEKLSGKKGPELKYNETKIEEIKDSISKVLGFLQEIKSEEVEGKENNLITNYCDADSKIPAFEYVTKVVLPNFYFHITTTYDILRHNGVILSKGDYIGEV